MSPCFVVLFRQGPTECPATLQVGDADPGLAQRFVLVRHSLRGAWRYLLQMLAGHALAHRLSVAVLEDFPRKSLLQKCKVIFRFSYATPLLCPLVRTRDF